MEYETLFLNNNTKLDTRTSIGTLSCLQLQDLSLMWRRIVEKNRIFWFWLLKKKLTDDCFGACCALVCQRLLRNA